MFIGHYAAAFAARAVKPAIPLWQLFVAVQLVDFAWAGLVLAGIEKMRVTKGFMEASMLDLHHMPYTHSLVSAVVWAIAAGVLYAALRRGANKWMAGAIIAGAVFSHWLLDLVVHVPDLELWPGGMRVGFGLWNNYPVALAVEFGVLLGGFVLYLRMTEAKGLIGRIWPWVFMALLALAEFANHAAPIPEDMEMAGYMGTATFLVLTALAGICDLTRKTR